MARRLIAKLVFLTGSGNAGKPCFADEVRAYSADPVRVLLDYSSLGWLTMRMIRKTDILGHTSISTTMNIYTRVFDDAKREAADVMDRLFGGSTDSGREAV